MKRFDFNSLLFFLHLEPDSDKESFVKEKNRKEEEPKKKRFGKSITKDQYQNQYARHSNSALHSNENFPQSRFESRWKEHFKTSLITEECGIIARGWIARKAMHLECEAIVIFTFIQLYLLSGELLKNAFSILLATRWRLLKHLYSRRAEFLLTNEKGSHEDTKKAQEHSQHKIIFILCHKNVNEEQKKKI